MNHSKLPAMALGLVALKQSAEDLDLVPGDTFCFFNLDPQALEELVKLGFLRLAEPRPEGFASNYSDLMEFTVRAAAFVRWGGIEVLTQEQAKTCEKGK